MTLPYLEHALYGILLILLGCATYTDLKKRLIYDRFILIGALAAIGIRAIERPEPWWNYLLTSIITLFILLLIATVTGEQSIGGGDIKLFAMLGLAVGFQTFLVLFFLSHILAGLYFLVRKLISWKETGRKTEIPFAPFITVGLILIYIGKIQ
ncbi:prepilin peptidase [Baia soyae]|uniref:Type IV leader peptidase family protein n=1 Tax=Baia soyae TaxID=1544746 RepID=A0A4V2SY91_9BACL|nr:A24 family peptidase [Baia soyae]TCP69241.1 type IV leader peptidase family protein [Baia soyae]